MLKTLKLNLNDPTKSDIKYTYHYFNDGEPHLIIHDLDRKNTESVNIICSINGPIALYMLMLACSILKRQGIRYCLDIKYLMSMRMDRVMSFDEAFSLEMVSNIINSLEAMEVRILEPHSHKVEQYINNCKIVASPLIAECALSQNLMVMPDAGAARRYGVQDHLVFEKTRDASGTITGLRLADPVPSLKGYKGFSVIDDLCDGGRTFTEVAKELDKIDPSMPKYLYVTHMVNSEGLKKVSEAYDEVFITNSFAAWNKAELPNNVTVRQV